MQAGFPCWGFPITPLSQRHGRPTRSPHIDTGHMCHRWPGTTRRIGHEHFARWPETTRRIGHAHSARWPGNTRRIRHGHFAKWAGHIEVSLRYSMLPTQLLNRMSSFRSSLRCTSSRDASRAKGVGGRVVAVGCFGLPYDGLGPHLRPIPTGPNGRGSPQKSHPTDPRLDFCGCPGRSA